MRKAFSVAARSVSSALGSLLSPGRESFQEALYAAEAERHRRILEEDGAIPRNPPGYSILDDDSPAGRGFFPLRDAARRMGETEEETVARAMRGELEAFALGSTLYVRPAVVTTLASRRPSEEGAAA